MFLMSFILWGALAAAIPIVVHLLHRQKTVPIQWGAMQFLLETPLKLRRRQRIDHWLLMLLRMAILVLLAVLLARPIIQGVTYSTETPMDVVLVLDHSLSMSRRVPGGNGGGTLFEQAIASAQKVTSILPPRALGGGASVGVVLAEHSPRVITPLPVPLGADKSGAATRWPQVLQQLRELKPGATDANIPLAVQAAAELAARGSNLRKMIVVISDDQRSNWQLGDEAAWGLSPAARATGSVPVYSMPLAITAALPNVSVSSISVLPGFVGVHRPAQIHAAVTQTGGGSDLSNLTVRLLVDSRPVESQQVARLAPGQSITVRFTHAFTEAGSHAVAVKAELVDALDADNAASAVVGVSPKLPVLIVDGQLTAAGNFSAAQYLLIAMQAGGAEGGDASSLVAPRTIGVSELSSTRLQDFPIVILNDVPRLPAETVRRLAEHVQQGNAAWLILGPRTQLDFLNDVLARTPLFPAQASRPVQVPTTATPVAPDIREPQNPAFASLTGAQQNALAGVNFRGWWPVKPASPQLHTILATTGDAASGGGDPLILETDVGQAGGRVIVWTSPVSGPQWNNLYISGSTLVPLVNETLFHLASGKNQNRFRPLNPGEAIVWTGPPRPTIESATLTLPDGSTRSLVPQLRGDQYLLSDKETFMPGLYELRFQPAAIPQPVFFSVNIDRRELDTSLVSPTDVDWLRERKFVSDRLTLETLPAALGAQRGGFELWWPLAILLVGALVLETVATWHLAKKQTAVELVS